jgi:histidinol-phosphate aminotransferase
MNISRRNLIRNLVTGAAAAALPGRLAAAEGPAGHVGPIRLNRNESIYGPSPKAIAAIQEAAASAANRYPDVEAKALQQKISSVHGVSSQQVVLGNGSTEVMRMAVDAFAGNGNKIVMAQPTFEPIAAFAQRSGAAVVSVPLSPEYSHDLSAMRSRVDATTRLVYICNPNNPTGTLTPRRDIEAFIRSMPAATYVLIDEAYHHYVSESDDYVSFIDRPLDDDRVIVTRTFSKIYGLAGLRVGYAIASPATASLLAAQRSPDAVNILAARAALASLEDAPYAVEAARRNTDDRQEFFNEGYARMARTIDSHTNFVMVHTGGPAAPVFDHFRKHNIALPPVFPLFDEFLRVSVGTRADMREFWRVWDLMGGHKMSHD